MTLCYMRSIAMSQGTVWSRLFFHSTVFYIWQFERWPEEICHAYFGHYGFSAKMFEKKHTLEEGGALRFEQMFFVLYVLC